MQTNNALFYTFSSVRSLFNTVIDGHQDLSSRVRMENERMTGELKNDVKNQLDYFNMQTNKQRDTLLNRGMSMYDTLLNSKMKTVQRVEDFGFNLLDTTVKRVLPPGVGFNS